MNVAQRTGIAGMLYALLAAPAFAQTDYLNPDGRLAHELSVEATETGGFVGVQSYSFKIAPDGRFTKQYAIGSGPLRAMSGVVSGEALAALAAELARSDLGRMPSRIVGQGKPPTGAADIPTIEVRITWGDKQVAARYVMGVDEPAPAAEQIAAVNRILAAVRNATGR
ncbi:MAG: hypothetical protein WD030_01270 [Pirellulales bacterium]